MYIQSVFSGIQLGNGMTIHEADLEGAYTEEIVRVNARSKDCETNWNEVPDWKLERFSSAITFFDDDGFRFYLPALLIWCLRKGKHTNEYTFFSVICHLTSKSQINEKTFSKLSYEMKNCVFLFLSHIDKYYEKIDDDNYFYNIFKTS